MTTRTTVGTMGERARLCLWGCLGALACTGGTPAEATGQGTPSLPTDLPVWLVGTPEIDGRMLQPYESVQFAIGRDGKDGPLTTGEEVAPGAVQALSLRAETRDGREVWVRGFEVTRPGDGATVLAAGEIVLDRRTLAPLSSTVGNGDATRSFEYDWTKHEVRGPDGSSETMDMVSLEAGAHETWIGAIAWRDGMRVMIPTILAGGGGKWWAVPHVVGSEEMDLGDGTRRATWIVELDWWGMGADSETFTPGGGVNGTAGTGGKYWVLKEPLEGMPRVVRVRTEVDADTDSVTQIQGEVGA